MKNSRILSAMAALALALGSTLSTQAAVFIWNVATPAANNWNVTGNWNTPGFPGSADTAVFNAIGTSAGSTTINNVVSVDTTVTTLNYTNVVNNQWHVTQIPAGVTLNVTNLTVGFPVGVEGYTSLVAMNDAGTFRVFGTSTLGTFGLTTTPPNTTLDMSGLSNFVYSASAGTLNVGLGNRGAVNLNLAAASNSITAATLNLNQQSTSSGASGTVKLGLGTNIINAGAISMAQSRNNSTLSFFGATGGLRLRGVGGTDADRGSLILANRNQNTSGGNNTGTISFNGHPIDAKFSTMTIGQAQAATPTGAQSGIGIINFDTGTIDATTILMAISSANAFNSGIATITVGTNATLGTSGTLIVGAGGISLANQGTLGTSTGNLNINGGSVACSGNIVKANATGTGNINITNGTLAASGTIGTLAVPLNNLVVSNATLQLTASISTTNVVVGNLNAIAGTSNTINISAMSVIPTFPTQIPLIKYTTAAGDLTTFTLGTLPAGSPIFQGYISNNTTTLTIDLVITNGPVPPPAAKSVTWNGGVSGDWDTTTINWLNAGNLTNYNNLTISGFGDPVTFDDTLLGTTNVNLTQTVSPGSLTVNNTLSNYLFTGSGKISGSIGLTKLGNGTLTIANSGNNDFTGGVTISGGTLQVGDGATAGTIAAASAITDNGALIFNHSDAVASSGIISGSGTVAQNGAGTSTLSGNNTFTGGLIVNAGAVRANSVTAPGAGLITVNTGGTFVVGAAHTNSITLSNAVTGTSLTGGFTMNTNHELIIAANSTNIIYSADPQSPTTSFQFLVDANLRGSGTVLIINAPTNSPDAGQGVRFRNTNAVSDFSGTVIYTNGNKGELLVLTPAGGSFSPIGTGKLVLYCGAYDGGNLTTGPANGTGFSELNLRNNGPGSVTIGNDISLAGSGAAIINALAGTGGITMGNLKIGAGQELIGYKAASTVTNTTIFTSVTLTGNSTFSPHSSSFGVAAQAGTDFSLGNISEQTPGSSITMGGRGNLTLTGANTYTGSTSITNGVLYLSGSASIATSPNIVVASNATFNVSGLTVPFALGAAQTLSNLSSAALISGNADASLGTVSLTYLTGTPSFTIANGALTLASTSTINVNNTGAALTKGSYKIISATGGSVAGTVPSSVTVTGGGIATAVTPSLQITSSELYLVVPNTPPAIAHIVTNAAPAGGTYTFTIAALQAAAGWSDADNDTVSFFNISPTSNLGYPVAQDGANILYNPPTTNAEDFFTYTISDGTTTSQGTVYIEVTAPTPPPPATGASVATDVNGIATINFTGNPNSTNVVQASTNLFDWFSISTNVADGAGLWQVTDSDATNSVYRFYRSYQPFP